MITEARFRLLRKDDTSPSGYRIVNWCTVDRHGISFVKLMHPDYDALEPGICIEGQWYYEGDILACEDIEGVIEADENEILMIIWDKCLSTETLGHASVDIANGHITHTGRTIHDKED